MLRTVTKNSTIIIMKYTWYHRYWEIIQITGAAIVAAQEARFKGGKEKTSNALTSDERSLDWHRL